MSDIRSFYPNAEQGEDYTVQCIEKLRSDFEFDFERTILATSVCSDEIIRSATNFRDHVALGTPFQLGGLSGFPFTGETGFKAFAGHIPDDGFAIILYGPHIGISNSDQPGMVIRSGQMLESTCCGALMGVVNSFENDKMHEFDEEYDYQQWKITEQLYSSRNDIIKNNQPLIAATDKMFERIDHRIKALLDKTRDHFKEKTIALVGGIIVNTDHGSPDWFEEREFEVHSF